MWNKARILNVAPVQQQPGGQIGRAYNMAPAGEGLEINMYGEVVEDIPVDFWTGEPAPGLYISEKAFLDDLEKYKGTDRITIRINSVGGDLYAGIAIANRLKGLDVEITTIADALCASAAVAIYEVGTTRKLYSNSQIMVHEPSCFLYGRYGMDGLEKLGRQMAAAKTAVIKSYVERTGKTEEELAEMVSGETWMTGQEAIDKGFADEIIEGTVSAAITSDRKTVVSNGVRFPAAAMSCLPGNLRMISGQAPEGNSQPENGGRKEMTKQELMEQFPDLYNEVVREAGDAGNEAVAGAVEAERRRIREIDEIAGAVGDSKLVEEAKFGEKPMNAAELALEAMKRQNAAGNKFLEGMKKDAAGSGAQDVAAVPNGGAVDDEAQRQQDIMDGAALIAGIDKKGEQK